MDETKVKLFGLNEKHCVCCKANTEFQHQNLISSVKHGGGRIMVWACLAASGPGPLAIIDGTMNSQLYQQILQENVRKSVRELKLKTNKHTSCSTKELLKQKKFNVLEWPSQSLDLNPYRNVVEGSEVGSFMQGSPPTSLS
ncbi:hypothetical protein LDENG_00205850 [Lucifuga dentata]|nr:hypothetical protein LDENG_00205850 [Lucifuga dentata]